jgi:hypothetical protein
MNYDKRASIHRLSDDPHNPPMPVHPALVGSAVHDADAILEFPLCVRVDSSTTPPTE